MENASELHAGCWMWKTLPHREDGSGGRRSQGFMGLVRIGFCSIGTFMMTLVSTRTIQNLVLPLVLARLRIRTDCSPKDERPRSICRETDEEDGWSWTSMSCGNGFSVMKASISITA